VFPDGDPKLRLTMEKAAGGFEKCAARLESFSGNDSRERDMLAESAANAAASFARALTRYMTVKL
jgi:hypothetical protein